VPEAFGIAGPSSYCAERLAGILELGLTKLVLIGADIGSDPAPARESRRLLGEEALPTLR
jgi:hypothetical protein